MSILNIFKSDKDGIRRSHVKNLISVAMADGQLEEEEWALLTTLAKAMEVTEDQILFIKENPESVTFIPPKSYDARVQQIQDLVAVMTIDGNISRLELALCKKISLKLDVLPQIIDEMVGKINIR